LGRSLRWFEDRDRWLVGTEYEGLRPETAAAWIRSGQAEKHVWIATLYVGCGRVCVRRESACALHRAAARYACCEGWLPVVEAAVVTRQWLRREVEILPTLGRWRRGRPLL
jgi:hypothetical protein